MLLQDHVALITGANRGIGRAIALAFAVLGARIAVTGRAVERCQPVVDAFAALGGEAQPFRLNVTRDAEVLAAGQSVLAVWGKIDILVHSAGIIQYHTPVWATSVDAWDTMMQINWRGTFICSHAVVPHVKKRGRGIMVNVESSSARMADDDLDPYTATKWDVVGYTTSLARSLRPHGIRVNGLNPGWVDTDMSREFDPAGDPEWRTPDEIAEAVLFLAAQAPRDMTGQILDICGS